MPSVGLDEFERTASEALKGTPSGTRACVPIGIRVLSDQLTPVLAYRRLVAQDARTAPSFLLESVEGGERQGRYSIMGAEPELCVVARGHEMVVVDREGNERAREQRADPLGVLREIGAARRLARPVGADLPECVLGGWFGYAAYDSVRYVEPGRLPFASAPRDDRGLPDVEFGLYDGVIVFDHARTLVHLIQLACLGHGEDAAGEYERVVRRLEERSERIQTHSRPLPLGRLIDGESAPPTPSNMTREEHAEIVGRALEYIRAGDVFQVVVGQRFTRESVADPFDVYRALRAINPSPYMVYMQTSGCILVASSPEILCRVRRGADGRSIVTNRPLAGTRRRGANPQEDARLEEDLRADAKERAEHAMLVDLGRNDVSRVSVPGSVHVEESFAVERYSHVMHLSSTVTGQIRDGLDCYDALRAALPVGTISGAPKIRAMEIIDELESVRRGPYGGGMGYISLDGEMDLALALRTIVAPIALLRETDGRARWTYHLQAAGGIVADSRADLEFEETVSKSAAMARAIDLAERSLTNP
ncbi:MAG: chorismate-binding protein [Phycisphaeraceae bacterium]|nr:chorismate-binding protein [Phycisphaeraceae bacterium]